MGIVTERCPAQGPKCVFVCFVGGLSDEKKDQHSDSERFCVDEKTSVQTLQLTTQTHTYGHTVTYSSGSVEPGNSPVTAKHTYSDAQLAYAETLCETDKQ